MNGTAPWGSLAVSPGENFGQIEIGGPYAGLEFHNGSILPNRISLFYPLANSVDAALGYWQRADSRIWFLFSRINGRPWESLARSTWKFRQTPVSLECSRNDGAMDMSLSYRFCQNVPGFVFQWNCRNLASVPQEFSFFSALDIFLRTCSTYEWRKTAWTEYDLPNRTLWINFDDIPAEQVRVFIINAGEPPAAFTSRSKRGEDPKNPEWDIPGTFPNDQIPRDSRGKAAAGFLYRRLLQPGEMLSIIQVIGSCRIDEDPQGFPWHGEGISADVSRFEERIANQTISEGIFKTGFPDIDQSTEWAKAILAANRHYLDGNFVPMPCPAEYNFFFTHDVLLTDLGAVYFDPSRVRQDLEYLSNHTPGPENLIPHAYLWKDGRFVTEAPEADNWNHLWFLLVAARYLKHSGDRITAARLLPFMEKSIGMMLSCRKSDDLIWGTRPDWWDIGNRPGPKAYLTILTIRALREFCCFGSSLEVPGERLLLLEETSERLAGALRKTLWCQDDQFLMSFFEDGTKDPHLYMGSLLAAHLMVVPAVQREALLTTARERLLDPDLGIFTVVPMDFHLLQEFFHFRGNEAGDPYYYLNGGIWPHANAWYALGLMASGKKTEAFAFLRKCMTLQGVTDSPNGQAAMFEYRIGDRSRPEIHGQGDKPQFLWAAGWYLYCLYHLFGVREDTWNLAFDPWRPAEETDLRFDLALNGTSVAVSISGQGERIQGVYWDGKEYPSLVIPETPPGSKAEIRFGPPAFPLLEKTDSRLLTGDWDPGNRRVRFLLASFPGHRDEAVLLSPWKQVSVRINGVSTSESPALETRPGVYVIRLARTQEKTQDWLEGTFSE